MSLDEGAPPCNKKMRHDPEIACDDELVVLNRMEDFGCDRWREHFRARGLFDPQAPQGTEAWLRARRFASGSTFYELYSLPIHELLRRYVRYQEDGGHPRISDCTDETPTVLNQHLARGHAGEPLVTFFLKQHLEQTFPGTRIFLLECPSMPMPGMPLASDSPDGAAVICRCATGGECVATAVEIKFPWRKADVVCPHTYHECARVEPHVCGDACPRVRLDLQRLFVPSRSAGSHPCQMCLREQMDYVGTSSRGEQYYNGYFTQCLMHQIALGVDRTIFVRPANTFDVLRAFGLGPDNRVDEFRARVDECIRTGEPRLGSQLFRVYVVDTPDNFIAQKYRDVFESAEFLYLQDGGIAGHFVRLCQTDADSCGLGNV